MGNLILCERARVADSHAAPTGHRVTSLGEVTHVIAGQLARGRLYLAMTEREV
jgi:hypothetical protein